MTEQVVKAQQRWRRGRVLAGAAFLLLTLLSGLLRPTAPVAAAGWQGAGTLPGDYSSGASAVLLADGRVLVVSREQSAISTRDSDTWTALPALKYGGSQLLALQDGGAVLIGGSPTTFANDPYAPTRQVLRFDPGTATWIQQKDLPDGRGGLTLTTLRDGTILVVGGTGGSLSPRQPVTTYAKVGRYDPTADTWTTLAPLAQARSGHTATLLPDGRVLVVGGSVSKTVNSENAGADPLASVEIYTPTTDSWQTVAPLSHARSGHTATLLNDGTVLIVGGDGGSGQLTAERYNPQANSWTGAGTVGPRRTGFKTTLLLDGTVLLTGGLGSNSAPLATTATFTPGTNSWLEAGTLPTPRGYHGAVLVNGAILLLGGVGTGATTSTARYDATPAGTVCYSDTGRCVGGTFQAYWQAHGQLPINGFPLSNPFPEQLEDGKVYLVQYFERVRMEAHPENTPPNTVLLGQFGRKIHPADPPAAQQPGGLYFEQTGHNLTGGFAAYWEAKGGLAQFGYPLSEVITETLGDGKSYEVQYFERARFEYHPENSDPQYQILLGQFGRQLLAGR